MQASSEKEAKERERRISQIQEGTDNRIKMMEDQAAKTDITRAQIRFQAMQRRNQEKEKEL